MPDDAELILDACREIAAELQAVAADAQADLTPEGRRWLVEIAMERTKAGVQSGKEEGPG